MTATQVDRSSRVSTLPLSMRGIVKRWQGAAAPVLDGADLDVEPGSVVAVTGRNGSGKTTLLRIAAAIIVPEAGEVRVAGLDPERERRTFQRKVGFVSAGNAALYARLTVDHHLDMWGKLAMLPRSERRTRTLHVLDRFALEELRGRRVDRLSMGQRQRLRLALGFMHDPEMLLLDEPENSLDEEAVGLLADAIEEVRARGGATVICSPSGVHDALSFDRRLALADGRLEPS
jgi:ABC-type multidrug transport system ATPase subunit